MEPELDTCKYLSSWVACEHCERIEKNPVAAVTSRRLTP
jgi:hypothetical protein